MEWETVKLGGIATLVNGRAYAQPELLYEGKYKIVRVGNLSGGDNWFFSNMELGEDKYCNEGDLLYAWACNFGPYIWHGDKTIFHYHIWKMILDESLAYKSYLYYYLKYITPYWLGNVNGSVMVHITKGTMEKQEFPLPPLETQRRIAAILSSLDDKIENNNRINRNLEAQAQALFKSWFIDFEPFGGVMPEDWKFDDISNIPHVLETGRRPKGGAVESGVPSIGAEHIKGMGTYDFSKTKYITEDYARSMKSGKINGYELLIYKDGGKPGYFIPNFTIYGEGYPFEECYINEHVLKLDFPSKAYNIFCYFYFQTPEVMNYLNAQGGKAAIPGINKSDIDNINILTPDNNTVVEFGEIVLPYFTSILQNLAENKRLATLRDTLLPKLMKGEIEV